MDDVAPIFISYRRSDAAGHARALYRDLSGRFGTKRIFFDRTSIEGGDVFTDSIREGVERCGALLALIAPEWLEARGADGNRRLENPADIVRQEIGLALELGKKVIPVLFDDTPLLAADRLPGPLKVLASRDAVMLRGKTCEYDTQLRELVRLLAKVPGVPEPFADAGDNRTGIDPAQLEAIIEARTRDLRELTNAQREIITLLKHQLGVPEGALGAFLKSIGKAEVPPEHQLTRLFEIATEWRQLRAQLAPNPGDAPEIARLKEAARAALDAGQRQEADDLLAQVETALDAALDQRQRMLEEQQRVLEEQQRQVERQQTERASTAAQRGGIALTRLRYREAAAHFATAARRLPPGHEEQALAFLDQEAHALYRQGEEFGDNAALVAATACCRALLDRRPRARVPLDWAMTQNNLGNALATLGEQESGTARLEEAVAAYRAALKERTRARVPLDWAMTQNNLGLALATLGERESGAPDGGRGRLEEAVAAYRAAFEEHTRARVPLDWAMTQNNLGTALATLGQRESGAPDAGRGRLEEAVAAYRAALEEHTRARVPLQWAATQNNLGTALATLGQRESGTARLEEAAAACRAALEEYTRARVPLQWAMTQNNLGTALATLGERESGASDAGRERLEEALQACRAALEVLQAAGASHYVGIAKVNLARAEALLAERRGATVTE
jgi:tetratricopeptide (TPR) repeat protein